MKTVIEMAKEVVGDYTKQDYWPFFVEELERFAELVRAAERKEILAFASSEAFNRQHGERSPYAYELANAIRARGQA